MMGESRALVMEWSFIILSTSVIFYAAARTTVQKPEQIHLSYGDTHDSMVVMWSSRDLVDGEVHYGPSKEYMLQTRSGRSRQLPDADYNAARFIYRAVLTNLTMGRRYFYKVVSRSLDDQNLQTESDHFTFRAPSTHQAGVARYLVYGDMGAEDTIPTYNVLENLVASRDYEAIWHVGDLGYDLHSQHGRTGDRFMNKIQPFAATIPYMTSPGNHEIADEFIHYRTRFSQPDTPWPIPVNRMWYSYNVGLVHFISYSTEIFFTDNENNVCAQFDWLLQDLTRANQNRGERPWIIAMGHRPMYCSNNNGDDCTNRFLRRWVKYGLEDLFHAQGVDLIVEAHEHSYERLWPVYDGHVINYGYENPRASVHVISGAAGNTEGVDALSNGRNKWSAFSADKRSRFTYGSLEVHNSSHIFFDQRDSTDNNSLDSFWLIQRNHGPFVANVTCNGTGSDVHPSCICPSPLHYIYFIIEGVTFLLFMIGSCVVFVCCLKKYNLRSKRKKGTVAAVSNYEKLHNEEDKCKVDDVFHIDTPVCSVFVDVDISNADYETYDDRKLLL